jgi:hypothetical protein
LEGWNGVFGVLESLLHDSIGVIARSSNLASYLIFYEEVTGESIEEAVLPGIFTYLDEFLKVPTEAGDTHNSQLTKKNKDRIVFLLAVTNSTASTILATTDRHKMGLSGVTLQLHSTRLWSRGVGVESHSNSTPQGYGAVELEWSGVEWSWSWSFHSMESNSRYITAVQEVKNDD